MFRLIRTQLLRSLIAVAMGAACVAAVPLSAQAQEAAFPSKPVRFLVPFPPGGAADIFARLVGDRLAQKWGQPVVVENRPGGGGIVATQAAVRAPADGYTLLVVTVGHAVNPALHAKLPYDTLADLQPVARLATVPSVLVVNPSLSVKTVAELVALAKSQPGKLTYASSGNATTSHVAGAMFTSLANVDITHVPYRGSAPAISDLLGGQVSMIIDPISSSANHIQAGKLRALAVSTATHSALAPNLPTLAESGLRGYDFSAWFLLLAPKGVSPAIVAKVNQDVSAAMASVEIKERYKTMGAEPGAGTPQELAVFLAAEVKRLGEVAKAAGMKVE
jgi:tripartite-type tricarboxylate transporter receptor subunit TctC